MRDQNMIAKKKTGCSINPNMTLVVSDAVRKYHHLPSRTLARLLFAEHPTIGTVELFRNAIRQRRGTMGQLNRAKMRDRVEWNAEENKYRLPSSHARAWEPHVLTGVKSALIIGDLHIPYHIPQAIEAAFETGLKEKVDTIIVNGDAWDCHRMSRFLIDPKSARTEEEYESVLQFKDVLEDVFPEAKVIWKIGNHDARLETYIAANVPEIAALKIFRWEDVLHAGPNMVVVPHKKPIKMGDLWVLHGDEWRNTGTAVNPARGAYLRVKECCIHMHNHQAVSHTETSISGRLVQVWSVGCCCELHPYWLPINNWMWGHAIVRMDSDGAFEVENKKIVKGKVYPA